MFIELTGDETYRGKKYQDGDIIEVGNDLGDRLVLNGHRRSTLQQFESKSVNRLGDEEISALSYKNAQILVSKLNINAEGKSHEDYIVALKAYYLGIKGN